MNMHARRDTKRDELHPHEQDYIGKVARIDVPLKSVISLRRVADELRGLASRLEFLSHEREEPPATVMFSARLAVRRSNVKMKAIRGPGRPKKNEPLDPYKPTAVKRKSQKPAARHKM
jgi:hypothetical protein